MPDCEDFRSQLEMSSVRAMCDRLRLCARNGRRHDALDAIKSLKVPRRAGAAKQSIQLVLRALRQYDARFPHDRSRTKRTLWSAIRSLTPRYFPSPAFERLYVDEFPCDLQSTTAVVEAYASGRMSIVHRLLHYGYAEAADALSTLQSLCPGTSAKVPAGYPRAAELILREARGGALGDARVPLAALRAATVIAVVAADEFHLDCTAAFIQSRRPDLVQLLRRVAGLCAGPTQVH